MIPKIIHFCWFGGNSLPELALRCIASWRKYLPDHEIWQWSEGPTNENETLRYENENGLFDRVMLFDVNIIPYTAEAYRLKKYAFVSDYARFWILYQYGGIYFDTDVEVILPMDDIIAKGNFMGFETDPKTNRAGNVNPGLGLGVNPCNGLIKKLMDYYTDMIFVFNPSGKNQITIVGITTALLQQYGLKSESGIQQVSDISIYPSEYFCPINITTERLHVTSNTRTIHHYAASWIDKKKSTKTTFKKYLPENLLILYSRLKNYLLIKR